MPETTGIRSPDHVSREQVVDEDESDAVARRVRRARASLTVLIEEAERARRERAEVGRSGGTEGAVCAWNHFENIPTFYNWNNRPR